MPQPRRRIDENTYRNEDQLVTELMEATALSDAERANISAEAEALVREIRDHAKPGLMDVFLAEYGLSTKEGVALMCLAEALLRVPDQETVDALIEDKIAPSDWSSHLGRSTSPLVNASTWGLLIAGKVLSEEEKRGLVRELRGAVKRLGEPVIRKAVARAMKEMGEQFVLGTTIESAIKRGRRYEKRGYRYSYDMLGEAAMTAEDASRYFDAYEAAIHAIGQTASGDHVPDNAGISVKLSALHPRYFLTQKTRVMNELAPRLLRLCQLAAKYNIGLNIDAEEAERLSLSMDVIEAVLTDASLAQWQGFGVVVQAYSKRAMDVLDCLYELANAHDRHLMVRLVKGAYWDSEIKLSQVKGMDDYPVFTAKAATDISYMAGARKLLEMRDRIYPQFATHNAHTVAAVLEMAGDTGGFEFQKLHGMGDALHDIVLTKTQTPCRIYAPVGAHEDLLAYLVRRLLENGANSSFVNQIVNKDVSAKEIATDPFELWEEEHVQLPKGSEIFLPERKNSKGFDLFDVPTLEMIKTARANFLASKWEARPLIAGKSAPLGASGVFNPAKPDDVVGQVFEASETDIETALSKAKAWQAPREERAQILQNVAMLFEENFGEIFALIAREAGKSIFDAVAELREAVDFLYYYAANAPEGEALGVVSAISPWNFPLAIFTGQISAALAAGNAVIAKPAEPTPLIAALAVKLFYQAGVPKEALQLLPGDGRRVGAAITSDARVHGVVFTGSTQTAQIIRKNMADHLAPGAPFIAETGGLNAMIVDSTALPEQAVRAITESAFQSAGQRCSALRCLYLQEDVYDKILTMLKGATDEMTMDQPWEYQTDIGPIINATQKAKIDEYIAQAKAEGRLIDQRAAKPEDGHFVAPAMIEIGGIAQMKEEIFGPVLHIARFKADELDAVIADINNSGFGLTFGLQTRIDARVEELSQKLHVGNVYVNRNQIGAIVGSQPFGGEAGSGTGPKAGGPLYLERFIKHKAKAVDGASEGTISEAELQGQLNAIEPQDNFTRIDLPGPTGESNQYRSLPRQAVLCMGPGEANIAQQIAVVEAKGGIALGVKEALAPETLTTLENFSAAIYWGDEETARAYDQALAARSGAILPLITGLPDSGHVLHERHLCVDTTATGGNVALLEAM